MFNPQIDSQSSQLKDITEKFNRGFDVGLLALIVVRNKLVILLFFLLSFLTAFIYLRYAQPIYTANTLLQIGDANKANNILRIGNGSESDNLLAEAVEQIRSKVFLKRVVEKLDITVNYFSEGTFKNNELYKSSPYLIKANVKDKRILGQNIYVEFAPDYKSGKIKSQIGEYPFELNKWINTPALDFNIYLNPKFSITQVNNTVKSNKALFFKISDLDVETDDLFKGLEVKPKNELARTILIKMQDVNAEKATDIVNAIAEEFLIYDVERKSESSTNIINFIDNQLGLVYNDLKSTESDLQKFKRDKNISENEKDVNTEIMRYSTIEDQLLQTEMEEKLITELQRNISSNKSIDIYQLISMISGTDYENIIRDVVQNIQRLLTEKENMLLSVTPQSEGIRQINIKIDNQKKLLLESLDAIRVKYKPKYKGLLEKSSTMRQKFVSSPEDEVEYSRLTRLYSIREKYYTMLLEKKTEFSISKAGYVTENLVLEKAIGKGELLSPKRKDALMIALLVAILLSFGTVFVKYLFHDKIYSLQDITRFSLGEVSLLGVIPKYQYDIPVSQLIVDKNPSSMITEAFRTVRSNLRFLDATEGTKIVSVTSTISGEGKTFVAINVAGILAFTGQKVVIIDLDMRKPKIHKGFGVPNLNGMSTILTGTTSVDECFNDSPMENLKFITAGPIPPNPSELIMSPRLEEVLDYLKSKFDYIVVDNAPIGLVTDGITTIQRANYPIYVFRAGYSRKMFSHVLDRLRHESGVKNLSVILNDVDLTKKIYSYSYSYGYGYGYGYGGGYYTEESTKSKRKNSKK